MSIIFVFDDVQNSTVSPFFFLNQIQFPHNVKLQQMLSFFLHPTFSSLNVFQVFIKIPNVGINKINFICKEVGIFKTSPWASLTDKQLQKLSFWFEETFVDAHLVGADFKKAQKDHILHLKSLRNYRSSRLQKGLPARGQHTKNNAKTSRRIKILVECKVLSRNYTLRLINLTIFMLSLLLLWGKPCLKNLTGA